MKALQFLDTILREGFDNTQVQLATPNECYATATDFAQQYAGCSTVLLSDKTMKKGFDSKATYALVWMKNDRCELYSDWLCKADFVGAIDTDENIYFFKLS